jgi:hypothetical protein
MPRVFKRNCSLTPSMHGRCCTVKNRECSLFHRSPVHFRWHDQALQLGGPVLKHFLDRPIAGDVGAVDHRGMRLGVEVYQERALSRLSQAIGQIHRHRGFADPALLIENGDFHRALSVRLLACHH